MLESVDDSQDGAGWAAYVALRDKFGDAKRAQLSKQIKKFFKRKQAAGESAADYLSDMKAKLAAIDKYPAEKIWEIMKSTTVVQNLRDDADTELTKKLVSSRMAEAETDGKTLPYDQIESIIEHDQAEADEKTPKPRKDDTPDLAMCIKGGGRGAVTRASGAVGVVALADGIKAIRQRHGSRHGSSSSTRGGSPHPRGSRRARRVTARRATRRAATRASPPPTPHPPSTRKRKN